MREGKCVIDWHSAAVASASKSDVPAKNSGPPEMVGPDERRDNPAGAAGGDPEWARITVSELILFLAIAVMASGTEVQRLYSGPYRFSVP